MVTNVRSLVPKIEEVQEFLNRNQISIAFVTETWLRPTITDSVVNIVGYSLMRRDRLSDSHGGICIYIKVLLQRIFGPLFYWLNLKYSLSEYVFHKQK